MVSLVDRLFFFFSSRRRHTRSDRDWSSDVCSSDLRPLSWAIASASRPPGPERAPAAAAKCCHSRAAGGGSKAAGTHTRSEERRVGEEGRSRGSPDHLKKKKKSTGTVTASEIGKRSY